MMNRIDQFFKTINSDMTVILATSLEGRVTMRLVSPVNYHGAILIFTSPSSKKYLQLKGNPKCSIAAAGFFAEATAEFLGPTMLEENQALREAYAAKFCGAFGENVAFGGRDAEFILLHPTRLSGWAYENDNPITDSVPTIPFEIEISETK